MRRLDDLEDEIWFLHDYLDFLEIEDIDELGKLIERLNSLPPSLRDRLVASLEEDWGWIIDEVPDL